MNNSQIQELLQQAKQCEMKNNFVQAANLYEQAYLLVPNFNIERQLVKTLVNSNQVTKAFSYLENNWSDYLYKFVDSKLLIEVLLAQADFIGAQQVLVQVKWQNQSKKEYLQQLIIQQQVIFKHTHFKQIQGILQQILEILTLPLEQQVELVKRLHWLSFKQYLQQTKLLILNPYLHPIIKASVVEDLVKLQLNEKLPISFWGEIRSFIPQNYFLIADLKSLHALREVLHNIDIKGELAETLDAQVNLYAAMLYPYTDEIIIDYSLWITRILNYFGIETAQTLEKDAKAGKVDMWLDKFEELLSLFN
ncbi:hypothetical protein [Bombilactobacillus bombi]|uniref:hypothetical protein n=1 Tax=Bombilactobacillus bombi TaxID=1303590 RepID=UPI0015E626DB|nr:hypothetical protein [Bombilactobacillus bombi]MBA1434995.1 hypothetical protein [Bombilactobacillus bombi]